MPSLFCAFSNAEVSRRALENRFQCDLAVLQNFKRALPFGKSSTLYDHDVASCPEFQFCRRAAHELVVHEDFCAIRVRRNRYCPKSMRRGLEYGSEAAPDTCVADEVVLETGCVSELEMTEVAASERLLMVDETVAAPGATRAAPDPALSVELVEETVG